MPVQGSGSDRSAIESVEESVESLEGSVEALERFQRRSAAIETVFTLALLYVATLQVVALFESPLAWLIPVALLALVAFGLGWRNLWTEITAMP